MLLHFVIISVCTIISMADYSHEVSPVTEALTQVQNLLEQEWLLCTPIQSEAATHAPSSNNNYFSVTKIKPDSVIKNLVQAVSSIFTTSAHQDSYWKEYAIDTEMCISRSVIGYKESKLESHLRECLLSPVLTTITKRMTLLPQVDCIKFNTFLQPEGSIRLHEGPGKPASVDYIIHLEADDKVLRSIPIEAKQEFKSLYVKQLSAYMNKLGTCEHFDDQTVIGILMYEDNFQLGFSPLKWRGSGKATPIVYVTPLILWRKAVCVSAAGLLLLSTVHLISMNRLEYDEGNSLLTEVTDKLYTQPYTAAPRSRYIFGGDTPFERLLFVQRQQELIRQQTSELEANDKKIREQQQKIQEQQKKIQQELSEHTKKIEMLIESSPPRKKVKKED